MVEIYEGEVVSLPNGGEYNAIKYTSTEPYELNLSGPYFRLTSNLDIPPVKVAFQLGCVRAENTSLKSNAMRYVEFSEFDFRGLSYVYVHTIEYTVTPILKAIDYLSYNDILSLNIGLEEGVSARFEDIRLIVENCNFRIIKVEKDPNRILSVISIPSHPKDVHLIIAGRNLLLRKRLLLGRSSIQNAITGT